MLPTMPRIDTSRLENGKKKVRSFAYICSRNTLAAINTIFVFIGVVLISIAAYGKKESILVSLPVLGAVIACGVFLILVAVFGLIGAVRHNQVILFFYMVVMSLLFIVLLACSVAALAVTQGQQKILIATAWQKIDVRQRTKIEGMFECCGIDRESRRQECSEKGALDPCYDKVKEPLGKALSVSGGVGLFFSFALLLAVYLTIRYRNQKDARFNADAFL